MPGRALPTSVDREIHLIEAVVFETFGQRLLPEVYDFAGGVIEQKIERHEILVQHHDGRRAGLLRYRYFWDEISFMNLLWVQVELRGRGFGTRLVAFWEDEMRKAGYEEVVTSTLSSERAQHLYRRLGYIDRGCLLPRDEPLEIMLSKKLA